MTSNFKSSSDNVSAHENIKFASHPFESTAASYSTSYRLVRARRDGHDVSGPIPQPQLGTPTGLLMLFTHDWCPVTPANIFSMQRVYKPSKNRRWSNSQRAAAQDLCQWWMFISANGVEWEAATPENISDYGCLMAETISPSTNLRYSTSTVRRRMSTVETFYAWAQKNGMISNEAPRVVDEGFTRFPIGPKSAFLPHLGTAKSVAKRWRRPRGRDPVYTPMPIAMNDLKRVLARLGPPIFSSDLSLLVWERGMRSRRDRLIAELAYQTGMRADEIASISASDVINQARALNSNKWQQLILTVRTKGRNFRKVITPAFMIRALVKYHDTERMEAIDLARKRSVQRDLYFKDPVELFVNGLKANLRDVGKPINPETPSRVFTKAVLAEKLVNNIVCTRIDPMNGEQACDSEGEPITFLKQVAAHTFHDLRHTFAIVFYKSEVRRGNREPWQKLRQLLGHASVETTQKIYLRCVDVDEASLSDIAEEYLRVHSHGIW